LASANFAFGALFGWVAAFLPLFILWSLFWKAWSLWLAARKSQKIWFFFLLIMNTLGLLEILYIFVFSKMKREAKKSFSPEEAKEIGDRLGIKWDKWNVDQFRRGLDVELEHGVRTPDTNVTNDNGELTGKIALAHLNEIRDYYDRLEKLEKEGEAFWEGK